MNKEIDWTADKIKRIWEYYATNPDYKKSYFSYHSGENIIRYINKYIDFKKVKSVLDYGCGPGYLLKHLIKYYEGNFYGLDFSAESVRMVEATFQNNSNFGKAICINKLPTSFMESSMDLVIAVEVIEHLNDTLLEEMIGEIYRILSPGGYVVITTPNEENLNSGKTICPECGCIFHIWQHIRVWNRSSLAATMEKSGIKTLVCEEVFFKPEQSLLRVFVDTVKAILIGRKTDQLPHLVYIGVK